MASDETKTNIFVQLAHYLGNAAIKGTIAQLPKSFSGAPLLAQGWFPIADLAAFKRMRSLTKNPQDIVASAQFVPGLFEISPDAQHIRRTREFDADAVVNELANFALAAGYAIEATGFDDDVSTAEVSSYFARFGPVNRTVAMPGSTWDSRNRSSFLIEFQGVDSMVKALAASHTYEDSHLQVRARTKPDAGVLPAIAAAANAFPKNRVVHFEISSEPDTLSQSTLKALFEQFSSVKLVDYIKGARSGHVQFKQAVAKDIVNVIAHAGGVQVLDEPVRVRALEGEEERLYWLVAQERQKSMPAGTIAGLRAEDLAHAARFSKAAMKLKTGNIAGRRGHKGRDASKTGLRYHQAAIAGGTSAGAQAMAMDSDEHADDETPSSLGERGTASDDVVRAVLGVRKTRLGSGSQSSASVSKAKSKAKAKKGKAKGKGKAGSKGGAGQRDGSGSAAGGDGMSGMDAIESMFARI
ncbi:hypothetical protein BC831DRAFT_466041 [Entophlyctis helioformis]|nr:hypothetical protein BC831DRAFT_466041 [Entophlyctis helioformis]